MAEAKISNEFLHFELSDAEVGMFFSHKKNANGDGRVSQAHFHLGNGLVRNEKLQKKLSDALGKYGEVHRQIVRCTWQGRRSASENFPMRISQFFIHDE